MVLGLGDRYAFLDQVKGEITLDDKTFGFPVNRHENRIAHIQYVTDDLKNSNVIIGPPGYHYLGVENKSAQIRYPSDLAFSYYERSSKFKYSKNKRGWVHIKSQYFPEDKQSVNILLCFRWLVT